MNVCLHEKLVATARRIFWGRTSRQQTHSHTMTFIKKDCEIEKSTCIYRARNEKPEYFRAKNILLIAFESFIKLRMFAVCSETPGIYIHNGESFFSPPFAFETKTFSSRCVFFLRWSKDRMWDATQVSQLSSWHTLRLPILMLRCLPLFKDFPSFRLPLHATEKLKQKLKSLIFV